MKKLYFLLLCLGAFLFLGSCSEEEGNSLPDIVLNTPTDSIVLPATKNTKTQIDFEAGSTWNAETDVDWVTVSPKSGNAGKRTISLITKEANNTGLDRSGTLTLTGADGNSIKIAFTQTTSEVLLLKKSEFDVPCEGQDISLEFATNVEGKFKLMVYSDVSKWIVPNNEKNTRALVEDAFHIRVLPNNTRDVREATFQIYVVDAENTDLVLMESEKIYIRQEGEEVQTSSD